jgi:hypothetical protein
MRMFFILVFASLFLVCKSDKNMNVFNNNQFDDSIKAKVELKIFSGRENPTWELSSEQTADFLLLVKDLPETDAKQRPGGLGYQGFQVVLTAPRTKQKREISVFKGIVDDKSEKVEVHLSDKDKKLEKLLLQSGTSRLPSELSDIVRSEIDSNDK